jgi:hypothetical protein
VKFKLTVLIISTLALPISAVSIYAASATPAIQKAKQEAEAKGYIFAASQEEKLGAGKNYAGA